MKNVKCSDCDEYRNEWCEKVIDSPHPDMIRDCQYWHKRRDLVEVIRCRDCKHWTRTCGDEQWGLGDCDVFDKHMVMCDGYCAWAERREDPEEHTRAYWCENERYEIPERREE